MTIYTVSHGQNSTLIKRVAEMYIKDGDRVADVTYGKGVFWRQVSISRFHLYATDIDPRGAATRMDFTKLSYEDSSFDHLVLDPPYMHNPGKTMYEGRYKNTSTTGGMYHRDIIRLYARGMSEGARVLRTLGLLWVKCQDEIESGVQQWSHIELFNVASSLGLYAKDLFILTTTKKPSNHKRQLHARRNHSYLWLFQVPDRKLRMSMIRHLI